MTDEIIDEPIDDDYDAELMEKNAVKAASESNIPYNELEYQHQLFNPEAKSIHADINRDMALANMNEPEIAFIRTAINNIGMLKYIRQKCKLGSENIDTLFRRGVDVVQVSSLARNGFLRENLNTHRQEFSLTRKINQGKQKKRKFSLSGINQ